MRWSCMYGRLVLHVWEDTGCEQLVLCSLWLLFSQVKPVWPLFCFEHELRVS